MQIDGHTDAKGDPASNRRLSEQRAEAVLEWHGTEAGLDRSRLRATGYRETQPVAPETTAGGADDPRGRAENRRVVISARQDGGSRP